MTEDNFYTNKGRLFAACKSCHKVAVTKYRSDPKRAAGFRASYKKWYGNHKLQARYYHLKNKFGISLDQYEKLFSSQNGVCAICLSPPAKRRLHVDHCHSTGKNRGLLCARCNAGLGQFMDDLKLLGNAITYLMKWRGDFQMKARFQNKLTAVTRNDMLVSNALAIQALEAILISKGVIKKGEIEKAVENLMNGKDAISSLIVV